MTVQLKEHAKSKQAAPTAGPSADDRGPTKHTGGKSIDGRLLNIVGIKEGLPRVVMSGGSDKGVRVGMVGYIKLSSTSFVSFEIDQVDAGRCFAVVDGAREQLRTNAFVVINATPPRATTQASAKPRIIGRNVAGSHVEIHLSNGRNEGVTVGMHGRLTDEKGTSGPPFSIISVQDRKSIAIVDNTTIDIVARYTNVAFDGAHTAIQRRANGSASALDVDATAHAGVASASGRLPHFDTIQRAFGKHDISGVRAQVGGAATEASAALGAHAYATGNRVAFASAPDLHTAAHEAAHTVQQARGAVGFQGLGAADDEHERHADAVADAVVAGRSAESLLDNLVGAGGEAVQRKTASTESDAHKEPSWVRPATGISDVPEHVGSIFFRTKQAQTDARDGELFRDLATAYAPFAKRNLGQPGKTLGLSGRVVAYADPRRSADPSNIELSNRRANTVAAGLERAMVNATRLDIGTVHLQRVGAGIDPDARVSDAPIAEGNTLAPFRRADIHLTGGQAPSSPQKESEVPRNPPASTSRLHEAPETASEHDRWMPYIRQGNKKFIEGLAARIAVDMGPDSVAGGRAGMAVFRSPPIKPPWWDARAARFAHMLNPPSMGRSAQRNAGEAKRAELVHDALLLLRDYKEVIYYESTFLGPANEALRQASSLDPAARAEYELGLGYMHFMYLETAKLAWRVHDATE